MKKTLVRLYIKIPSFLLNSQLTPQYTHSFQPLKAFDMIWFPIACSPLLVRSFTFRWCSKIKPNIVPRMLKPPTSSALVEPKEIHPVQHKGSPRDQRPVGLQSENIKEQKDRPDQAANQLRSPEKGRIHRIRLPVHLVVGLKDPYFGSVFLEVVPPTKANQQTTGDVLDHPEIDGTYHDYDDEDED